MNIDDLPDPGEAFTPGPGQQRFVTVPTNQEAVRRVTSAKKRLADLPLAPKNMNAISVVLSYTLYGLDDHDIALACGITESQVAAIKTSEAFGEMMSRISENIAARDTDSVRGVIMQHARGAAERMAELSQHPLPQIAIVAAKDILDRAGHRPADVVEHRHSIENELNIVYTTRDANAKMPEINITPKEL